ncbi:MAG: hypothetical protein PHW63_09715 [Alphaproteobacteria bacterium]|nr:hypothetical protein [Alphaproteobacteria bacterium]
MQDKSSGISNSIPFEHLYFMVTLCRFAREANGPEEVTGIVDFDYDFEESELLYNTCMPIRNQNHRANEVLLHICMGHNTPSELKGEFL